MEIIEMTKNDIMSRALRWLPGYMLGVGKKANWFPWALGVTDAFYWSDYIERAIGEPHLEF